MADLLLPTVLTLAIQGPASAQTFLTALAGTRVTATHPRHKAAIMPDSAGRAALAGTRVTARRTPSKARKR